MRGRRHLLHLQLVTEGHRLQPTGHPQALRVTPAAVRLAIRVTPAAVRPAIRAIPAAAHPAIRVTPVAARPAIRVTPVAVRRHPPATPGGALHPGTLVAEHPEVAVIAAAPEDNKHLQHKKR